MVGREAESCYDLHHSELSKMSIDDETTDERNNLQRRSFRTFRDWLYLACIKASAGQASLSSVCFSLKYLTKGVSALQVCQNEFALLDVTVPRS